MRWECTPPNFLILSGQDFLASIYNLEFGVCGDGTHAPFNISSCA